MHELTFDWLRDAMAGKAAAFRILTRLAPVGGPGDKVFPPTYKHPNTDQSLYACERRRVDGREVQAVLLDSVASQANRIEQALLRAVEDGKCDIPVLSVSIPRAGSAPTRVTVLDAPHRVTDAIFRDSTLDGKPFRESPMGSQAMKARTENATALFKLCPTALVFGFWDSQAEGGVQTARVARALVSEIVGLDAVSGRKTSSRVDPLGITASAATIYKSEEEMWTLEGKGKAPQYGKRGKAGKPSAINHGNITPSVSKEDEPGGVTISEAVQTTILSLPQLRRLRFPDPESGGGTAERDTAGRTALAALALYGVALQRDEGYFLRSRCHLIPLEPPRSELLGATATDVEPFGLTVDSARSAFEQAYKAAKKLGLGWQGGIRELQPMAKLVELVRCSDEKVSKEGGDEDAGD